jgi:hypothetical protein
MLHNCENPALKRTALGDLIANALKRWEGFLINLLLISHPYRSTHKRWDVLAPEATSLRREPSPE